MEGIMGMYLGGRENNGNIVQLRTHHSSLLTPFPISFALQDGGLLLDQPQVPRAVDATFDRLIGGALFRNVVCRAAFPKC